jgi:hypothetical protein
MIASFSVRLKGAVLARVLGVCVFVVAAALCAAGSALAADPVIGTWKLNVAKSKFSPGPAPKAMTRVYTEYNGLYTLEQTITGAMGVDGNDSLVRSHYRNGKEEKQTGNPLADSIVAKRIDANSWDLQLKTDGKVTGNVHRVVAHDGKSMIVHNTGKPADGVKYDDTLLFEKQ